jgi:3-deoxy-D-manno-octulosonic-acid transferase
MRALYTLSIIFYTGLIHLVSLFGRKASLWVHGRKEWQDRLSHVFSSEDKVIWIHCASLGEFEQGRPVIEMLKNRLTGYKILITFFSPSGYEIRKGWPGADFICYLPADLPWNVSKFIKLVRPALVIFIKYEFWNNYISVLYERNIPLFLVSGIFHRGQYFFRWYGGFFRRILNKFDHIFVQDEESLELLSGIGLSRISVTGDTRFDRVNQIAANAGRIQLIEKFKGDEKIFIAGSSWRQDEEIICRYINNYPGRLKWIFAPHETEKANIARLMNLLKVKSVKYSDGEAYISDARVLIIDSIGILSSAYRYAYIAAVGGGFGKGIHNILEPACWKLPVLIGPNNNRFKEARELLQLKGAFCFHDYNEFSDIMENLLTDSVLYKAASEMTGSYILKNKGATDKTVGLILGRRY